MKKKLLSIVLAGCLVTSVLTGCSTKPEPKEETKTEDEGTNLQETDRTKEPEVKEEEGNEPEIDEPELSEISGTVTLPAEGKLKTGQGVYTKISSSKSATEEETGTAQVDTAIATVTYDSAGVIVKCVIDASQSRVGFDDKGEVDTDLSAEQKTKVELGDEYGMKKASAIEKEWYEQAQAFSDWTVGKTLEEVKGINVKKVDDSHPMVPDEADLTSSVSISVGDYLAAIEKAMYSEGYEFDETQDYKTGLGVFTSLGKSASAVEGEEGSAQVDSAIASVTVDAEGKIVACYIDGAQTKVGFDEKGEITSDLNADIKTKVELGDEYGMKKASAIEKEWYEQIKAYAEWTIGKTLDEVKGLQVKKVDDSHPMVPDVPELTSSVSISIGDYLSAVEKAVNTAK